MSVPTVFLSAASIDLKDWRDVLHGAFSRAGFRVLTQDQSLRSAPGDVRRLLTETITECDCIIHLAGMGYGSHATDPFPGDTTGFRCSWTQFEYYHGHREGKDVIAYVCTPDLSRAGFVEEGEDAADLTRKQRLQQEHRARVASGKFDGTPLAGNVGRTCNEDIDSVQTPAQGRCRRRRHAAPAGRQRQGGEPRAGLHALPPPAPPAPGSAPPRSPPCTSPMPGTTRWWEMKRRAFF